MAKKGDRSLVLLCVIFVFVCLLLSGGWRLIGSDAQEEASPVRPFASVRAMLSSMPAGQTETGLIVRRDHSVQRMGTVSAPENQAENHRVLSDANGNVLQGKTYMRAVYQSFVLDDGFV